MNHEEFELLAARHRDGLATAEEQHQMDQHLRSCPVCLDEVAESQTEAQSEAPGPDPTEKRRRPFFRWWLGAAALFFLALFGWSELRLRVEREDALQLEANLNRLATENARLFRGRARIISTASVIAGPKTLIVTMRGSASPDTSARAFFDPESRRAYLFVHGLAPDRYRLSAVARDDSAAEKLASFEVGKSGGAAVPLTTFPDLQRTARLIVTLDRASSDGPGSDTPLLAGTF